MDYPPVYQKTRPDNINDAYKKRWFAPGVATLDIANQTARNTAYNTLLAAYNAQLAKYNADILPKTEAVDLASLFKVPEEWVPLTKPVPPTWPEAYLGLRLHTTGETYNENQFYIDSSAGGWGALTMGILPLAPLIEKSFGMIGVGKTTTSPAFNA
jgi:hypothetical protein